MAHGGHWKRLGDGSLLTEDAEEGLGHVLPVATYMKIYFTLLVLTVVTVGAAQVDFGALNTVIALAIASVKALLVAMFFMHLKFENKTILMYCIYPLLLLAILIGGTTGDMLDRTEPLPARTALQPEKRELYVPPLHGSDHGDGHDAAGHGVAGQDGAHNHGAAGASGGAGATASGGASGGSPGTPQ